MKTSVYIHHRVTVLMSPWATRRNMYMSRFDISTARGKITSTREHSLFRVSYTAEPAEQTLSLQMQSETQ